MQTLIHTLQAQTALEQVNWNLAEAVSLYFAASEDNPAHDHDADYPAEPAAAPTAPQPSASTPSSSSQPPKRATGKKPLAMTLKDLQGVGDDSDDDDDENKPRDLFAGGEKSGLAVQDPTGRGGGPVDHFRNILKQAQSNRERPGGDDSDSSSSGPARTSAFSGRAQTLGGDEAESQVIEDPRARQRPAGGRERLPPVTRTLHLWSDGVSIDDGPLFRFDDPANQDMMAQINQGRAPLSLLDVKEGQEVNLELTPHKEEKYVAPPKVYKPFGGSGNRLGSPTPGPSSTASSAPVPAPAAQLPATASAPTTMDVDDEQPTLTLQIRLGDGTRLQSRFNTSHTIGDVYSFVNRASPASQQRAYALMTTFPSKELSDKAAVLGDMSDFKRGGVVVQKWT